MPGYGQLILLTCRATGPWKDSQHKAEITIKDPDRKKVIDGADMRRDGRTATYRYLIPDQGPEGDWEYKCKLDDSKNDDKDKNMFSVSAVADSEGDDTDPGSGTDTGAAPGGGDALTAHQSIQAYAGQSAYAVERPHP